MKPEKRIPTILGLLLLVGSVFGATYLTGTSKQLFTSASGSCQPNSIQITNLTHQSVAISYTTDSNCLSDVKINDNIYSDITKETTGNSVSSTIHYHQIFNLKNSTLYEFTIVAGGKVYSSKNYQFTTTSTPSGSIPTSNLAWGKVLTPDHQPASNAIVYLNIPGASPLSSFVTSSGNWNISLSSSFNDSKTGWFNPPASPVTESIMVIATGNLSSDVENTTDNNNPVPDIILGQNFLEKTSTSTTGNIPTSGVTSAPANYQLTISNPSEGESINTLKPEFFGNAPSNVQLEITVESPETYTGVSNADSTGNWKWSVPQNLTPGEHTITVKITNPITGQIETIKRSFVVLAADNTVAFTSTPSATLIPTKIPTLSPTSAPTVTPTIVLTSTPIPTSIRVSMPSTDTPTPVTGNTLPIVIIISLAIFLLLISRLLI